MTCDMRSFLRTAASLRFARRAPSGSFRPHRQWWCRPFLRCLFRCRKNENARRGIEQHSAAAVSVSATVTVNVTMIVIASVTVIVTVTVNETARNGSLVGCGCFSCCCIASASGFAPLLLPAIR